MSKKNIKNDPPLQTFNDIPDNTSAGRSFPKADDSLKNYPKLFNIIKYNENNEEYTDPFMVGNDDQYNKFKEEYVQVLEDSWVSKENYDKWKEDHVLFEDKIDFSDIENEKYDNTTIKTATPFIINTTNYHNKYIATLVFLCVTKLDQIITISRNYVLEDEIDKDIIESIDFHAESEFINNKICYGIISKYLPAYVSEFKFKVDNIKDNLVTLECTNIESKEIKTFRMNPEVFTSMKFIEDYVFKGDVENVYDLRLATVVGSKENNNIEFFIVENIENIVSMVSTKKKSKGLDIIKDLFSKDENTNIGLVFRTSRIINRSKEIVSILTPFDIGIELDKSKFKGDTVESLEENYYGDSDQYVATLIIDAVNISGIDKNYMIIRGKAKDDSTKVFLLDSNITTDLIHKIKEY